MNRLTIVLLFFAVAANCSARYLPKKEFIKKSSEKWSEVAKKIGLTDDQSTAAIDLMTFIQEQDIDSVEMDSNTEWKQSMLEKCEKLANFELIDELNGLVGDTKWSEVKNRSLSEKLDFWNAKYATFSCEHAKMKIMKNMCILITEDAKKKIYMDRAKAAGLLDEQITPTADLLWAMKQAKSVGYAKSILAVHCAMLSGDGKLFEINEKHMANMKWSDMADKNISTKLEFWFNVTKESDCKIAKVKALKNLCVEFMCPVERKQIENVAKEAGIQEDDIQAIVDMEMRMNMVKSAPEQRDMIMENFRKLGGNQYMMKVLLTDMELEKLELVNNASDWVPRVHFWAKKYNETTGVDHLNSLKNLCVVIMREKSKGTESKAAEKETEIKSD